MADSAGTQSGQNGPFDVVILGGGSGGYACALRAAHELANRLGIPSYDAAVVGYPQRMRDWNARKSARPDA